MEYTRERAMEWVNKKWNTPKACPVCKNNNWGISESLTLLPRIIRAGEDVPGNLVYPHFLVTCINCGYIIFFNAIMAGFSQAASEEER
jgi:hypothetical protein